MQKFICSNTNRRTRFEFALFVDTGMLSPMKSSCRNSANPLIAKVQQLFSHDLLDAVISIAKPDTLLAWNRRQKQEKWNFENRKPTAGRPRKAGDTEALIVRLAQDNNSWG